MLTLINTNRIRPPIAPIGLDYLGCALREAGVDVELLDLNPVITPEGTESAIAAHFARRQPELVGLSFRNVDDCFWPSGQSFLPVLHRDVALVRRHTDAPIVLGGMGFSVFPRQILQAVQADFGVHGDGEQALVGLLRELRGAQCWDRVPGLLYRADGTWQANPPAWAGPFSVPARRDFVDNATYFRWGGQLGLETKRGCLRHCTYCIEPLAKGRTQRLRQPGEVADEFEVLLAQGIDMVHLCDSEFNLPLPHALAVCEELIRRGLGDRVQWYAYLAVVPFTPQLATRMRRAGCVGINFTSDSSQPEILHVYGQPHRKEDLAHAVQLCRQAGLAVMLDMLIGAPGETPETVARTIADFKQFDPDCAGAALGIRVYPDTPLAAVILAEGPPESNPNLHRHYGGQVDLLKPTFYLSAALGSHPAHMIRELIGDDPRFFPPHDDVRECVAELVGDHNYNTNRVLTDAIAAGERGAYWDILRRRQKAAD